MKVVLGGSSYTSGSLAREVRGLGPCTIVTTNDPVLVESVRAHACPGTRVRVSGWRSTRDVLMTERDVDLCVLFSRLGDCDCTGLGVGIKCVRD